MVEQIYLSGDDDKLYQVLKLHIENQARIHCKVNGSPYTCYADYLSLFWELTWDLSQQPYQKGFYFVDKLDHLFEIRAIDMVRKATPHWPKTYGSDEAEEDLRVWTDCKTNEQMDRYPDKQADIETEVTDRMLIQTILSDPCLTEKDRQLLQLLYEQPEATYEELAGELGIRKQTVYEQLQRIRKKLEPYKADAMYRHQKWVVKNEKPV